MSLRPKLNEHRMTVYTRGVPEPRAASGLLMRIDGPVANEPRVVTRRRNLVICSRALAWLPFVVLAIFGVRFLLVLPGALLWIGVAILLGFQAFSLAVDFVLGRALFGDPRRYVLPLVALTLAVESATRDPAAAVLIALPVAIGVASFASHTIATQYAMWLSERLELDWEERDACRESWSEVRPLGLAIQVGIVLALGSFFFAGRASTPHVAGLVAVTLLCLYLAMLVVSCRSGPRAAIAYACEAIVCWFSYNHHGWTGPQTFQFAREWRDPRSRTALVLGTAALVTAAVVGATFNAPVYEDTEYASVFRRVVDGVAGNEHEDSLADVAPVFRLADEEELFVEQLPDSERKAYVAALKAADRETKRDVTERTSILDSVIGSLCGVLRLLPIPLLLLVLLFVADVGPVLAEHAERFGSSGKG